MEFPGDRGECRRLKTTVLSSRPWQGKKFASGGGPCAWGFGDTQASCSQVSRVQSKTELLSSCAPWRTPQYSSPQQPGPSPRFTGNPTAALFGWGPVQSFLKDNSTVFAERKGQWLFPLWPLGDSRSVSTLGGLWGLLASAWGSESCSQGHTWKQDCLSFQSVGRGCLLYYFRFTAG
jgi:hypothetical protein